MQIRRNLPFCERQTLDDAHKSALSYVVASQFMWFLQGKHLRKM